MHVFILFSLIQFTQLKIEFKQINKSINFLYLKNGLYEIILLNKRVNMPNLKKKAKHI